MVDLAISIQFLLTRRLQYLSELCSLRAYGIDFVAFVHLPGEQRAEGCRDLVGPRANTK